MGHLTVIMNEIMNAKEKGMNHEIIMSMFNGMEHFFSIFFLINFVVVNIEYLNCWFVKIIEVFKDSN